MPVHSKLCIGRLSRLELRFPARLPQSAAGDSRDWQALSESSNFCTMAVWGIHDHDLDDSQASSARSLLAEDIRKAKAYPLDHIVVLAGDLNRMKNGELKSYLDPIQHAHYMMNPSLHQHNISTSARAWDELLDELVEVDTN
eukprot:6942871-Karenia_brevis.AAC.1